MRPSHSDRVRVAAVAALASLVAACGTGQASPASPATERELTTVNYYTIPTPSLEDNLISEKAERGFWVYLPPQYFESDEPMRTVYYLPNYGDHILHNTNMAEFFPPAFATIGPLIVVVIDGENRYEGSFWQDSPVTGNWGTFVAEDVVDYVDANFRTVDAPAARGIAGHAMGGFGAFDIALRHPDVFGAAYAFAPWVARSANAEEILGFPAARIGTVVSTLEEVRGLPAVEVLAVFDELPVEIWSERTALDVAYGMAFAPLLEPPFFEYPYSRVDSEFVLNPDVWARWTPAIGGISDDPTDVAAHWGALTRVGIDCGSNQEYEWIPNACAYLDGMLTGAGVDHDYWPENGPGVDHVHAGSVERMLPFFDEWLTTDVG